MSEASSFLRGVRDHPQTYYIIHYSSQSLYDEGVQGDGLSPRITSIVVMHLSTRQTVTFATHVVAEELGIANDLVRERKDDIERAILERFFDFVRDRRTNNWVHWNMRNVVFGFEHLEHRYRLLTKKEPPPIPVEVRINLNDILIERYGDEYAPHPRMLNLMLKNGERDPKFLEGKEEAEAFKRQEYIRMHSSTIAKVEFFRHVIQRVQEGKLKTYGMGLLVRVDRLLESRWSRVAALVTNVIALVGFVLALIA
jgi:hypothetical protein